MKKRNSLVVLVVLILILIGINYSFIDGFLVRTFEGYAGGVVERVIDGDTIVVNNVSVRLLGINSPERGEKYYEEAKEFLEGKVLGKYVEFEFSGDRKDLYGRTLAYVIFENRNINLESVRQGFANCYFPSGEDRYYEKCFDAWGNCVGFNSNLCEKSSDKCAGCVRLENIDYKNEIVKLKNYCGFSCELNDWGIKDEGRKKFEFENFVLGSYSDVEVVVGEGTDSEDRLYWKDEDYVWTDSGDTLFLRDSAGKLVLYYNY